MQVISTYLHKITSVNCFISLPVKAADRIITETLYQTSKTLRIRLQSTPHNVANADLQMWIFDQNLRPDMDSKILRSAHLWWLSKVV